MWQTSTRPSMHKVDLKKFFPYAKDELLKPVCKVLDDMLEGNLVKAHFLAQLAHESDGFKTVQEYASGKAYEGRKDLGNTQKGDGVRYKGRGYIQCTGRANYTSFTKDTGFDVINKPELLLEPEYAMMVSQWYWSKHNLNALALKDDLRTITKKINGGVNGLADRERCLKIFKKILGV